MFLRVAPVFVRKQSRNTGLPVKMKADNPGFSILNCLNISRQEDMIKYTHKTILFHI